MTKIFEIWRFVISIGIAKSGLWENTINNDKRIHLFTISLLKRNSSKAISIIIVPLSLMIGFK